MILENVFNYIHENAHCDIHTIAETLKIEEKTVLAAVEELQIRNLIKLDPVILGKGKNKNSSCYYETITDSFSDEAENCHCKTSHSVWLDMESNPYGYWDTCGLCNKHIDDGFHYYNNNDSEDSDVDI